MSEKFENLEAAKEAQKAKAAQLKEAKTALLDYFKENKLKKTEDYSEDKKHGKKIQRLEGKVEKYSEELSALNDTIKKMGKGKEKSSAPKNLKYEYPDDVKTSEQRKKYRIEQRKLAKAAEAGETEEPKSKKKAKAKAEPEAVAEKPAKTAKSKGKSKAEAAPAAKAKSKRRKEVEEVETEEGDD